MAQLSIEDILLAGPEAVTAGFKSLLEDKHLYQSVDVGLSSDQTRRLTEQYPDSTETPEEGLLSGPWVVATLPRSDELAVFFVPPTVLTFCGRCDKRFPFKYVGGTEALRPFDHSFIEHKGGPRQRQPRSFDKGGTFTDVYALSYQCQACNGVPEVFLVKRKGLKLTLCGRAPIEHVEVEKFIPRPEAHWYSDSIVAYQSGQELAALFLLRTFIEQFARRRTGGVLRGDELMVAYMEPLPQGMKDAFPSLRKIYEDISAALHAADPTIAPFEAQKREVDRHFDARRLYAVPDVSAT